MARGTSHEALDLSFELHYLQIQYAQFSFRCCAPWWPLKLLRQNDQRLPAGDSLPWPASWLSSRRELHLRRENACTDCKYHDIRTPLQCHLRLVYQDE